MIQARKYGIMVLLQLAFVFSGPAQQNLVPNGSFENYSVCPWTTGHLYWAVPWFDPNYYSTLTPGGCAVDFIHLCSSNPNLLFFLLYDQAPRTDSGYAFALFFGGPAAGGYYREYLEIGLTDTLRKDTNYCVSFWVSLRDSSTVASDHLGAHFCDTLVSYSCIAANICPLYDHIPQVVSSNGILADMDKWMHVSGSFTAEGGEKYLLIGNFFPLDSINYIYTGGNLYTAYYVDDVAVYECGAPSFAADAGNDTLICRGDSAIPGSHQLPEYRYYWYVNGQLISKDPRPVFAPDTTTTYVLMVKDFKFDESYDTVTVWVIDCDTILKANAGSDTLICLGDSILIGRNHSPNFQYTWTLSGDTTVLSMANRLMVAPASDCSYILTVIDYMGQISFDTIKITVVDCDIIKAVAGNDTTICLNDSAILRAEEFNGAVYQWLRNLNLLDSGPVICVIPTSTTTYTLAVYDPKGRYSEDEVTIHTEECDIPLEIPNVFTPNNDGINDRFSIVNPLRATLEVRIFTRWGNVIYTGDEQSMWDGSINNKPVDDGVYYYVVRASLPLRRTTEYSGVVHVER